MSQENAAFDNPDGIIVELVDDYTTDHPVGRVLHKAKKVLLNGVDISQWVDPDSVRLLCGPREATRIRIDFYVADVKMIRPDTHSKENRNV